MIHLDAAVTDIVSFHLSSRSREALTNIDRTESSGKTDLSPLQKHRQYSGETFTGENGWKQLPYGKQ